MASLREEPRPPIEMIGAFESTFIPLHDVDVIETTRHDVMWQEDIDLLRECGVRRLRYPIRWHRIERQSGNFDWRSTDRVLGYLHDQGFEPIIDLCHHTSYPRWVGGFADPQFGPAFIRFAEALAERYPWVAEYTLFNEPFTTFLLCGQEGVWAPHLRGLQGMLELASNVLPAVAEISRMYRELLPDARHVYVEACERHTAAGPAGEAFAAFANDRRWFFTDLFLGRSLSPDRPFVAEVLAAGGEELLVMEPGHIDVLGLDYYAHCQWHWSADHEGVPVSPVPAGLADLMVEYWQRFQLPCLLGETNIRGCPSDRASWLKYTLEQCEMARDAGVPVDGYCWFPFIDSCDWDSLLARADGNVDPVGVYWLDEELTRRSSSMSRSYATAARGLPSAALPAYRFRDPAVLEWVQGFLRHMEHWDWQSPPDELPATHKPRRGVELRIP